MNYSAFEIMPYHSVIGSFMSISNIIDLSALIFVSSKGGRGVDLSNIEQVLKEVKRQERQMTKRPRCQPFSTKEYCAPDKA